MALNIGRNGIVRRHTDGTTSIVRPGKNGGGATLIEVSPDFADQFRLVTGDVVEGETESIFGGWADESHDDAPELRPDWDLQIDEPSALRDSSRIGRPPAALRPTERLVRVLGVNGLNAEEADERPYSRTKRSHTERTPPDRLLPIATSPGDTFGRLLDFAAPLGAGVFGVVYGPHGGGLSRTLQTVLHGIVMNAPDCAPLVLLLRPRAEEATEWRRRIPGADLVIASSAFAEAPPDQTLQLCDLVLEAAQRQTELGRDVILLIDSMTSLWGTMLEMEEADAQHEADMSAARARIREWAQKTGCFHGATPLGGGPGGSLTILGTVWHQAIDEEAEEERDTHPHLRLLEHVLPEASYVVALSETLKRRRLYPAVDVKLCRSQYEERLLPQDLIEPLLVARGALPRGNPVACHRRVMNALEGSTNTAGLLDQLSRQEDVPEPAFQSFPAMPWE